MIHTGQQKGYVPPFTRTIEVLLGREILYLSQGLPTETENEENVY